MAAGHSHLQAPEGGGSEPPVWITILKELMYKPPIWTKVIEIKCILVMEVAFLDVFLVINATS